jgi:hypothetical protein
LDDALQNDGGVKKETEMMHHPSKKRKDKRGNSRTEEGVSGDLRGKKSDILDDQPAALGGPVPVGGGLIPKQSPLGLAMPLTQGMVSNGTGKNPFVSTAVAPAAENKKGKKRDE